MHEYRAYGLHMRSAVALPFDPLQPKPSSAPDLTVRLGAVPRTLPAGPGQTTRSTIWQARPGTFLIELEGVARYLATDGRDILVEPLGDAGDVASTFVSAALAPCLQQRGVATLHAAAVAGQGGAVLLLGPSAVGKSSLAAALVERGHALLADDVTGVALDAGGQPLALPAFPRQKLWAQTLDRMDWRGKAGARVRRGLDKHWTDPERHCAEPQPMLAAVALAVGAGAEIDIEPLSCGDAFWALTENTHRKQALDAMGGTTGHFRAVAALAQRVPMLLATRPRHPFTLEALAARVDAQLRTLQLTASLRPSVASGERPNPPLAGGAGPTPVRRVAAKAPAAIGQRRPDAPEVVWLASYPKSGSTWLRAVLTNYASRDGAPASINALLGGPANHRRTFDEFLGTESTNMTEAEAERHLPQFREWLAEGGGNAGTSGAQHPVRDGDPFVRKTHDAYRTARGAARFPPTGAAVYLVRNPLDVAVSYAHHGNLPVDRIVALMNSDGWESHIRGGVFGRFPEPLTTWSGHVASWTEQADLPVHVARYEDLLARPRAGFAAIVRFMGLGEDPARLRQAVERSSFARLQAQEAEFGFDEKQPTAQSFFRAGVAGSWRTALTREQVRALVDAHGEVMAKFGYLDEALAFLG